MCAGGGGSLWGRNRELACILHIRGAREQLGHGAHVPLVSRLLRASPFPAPLFFLIRRLVFVYRLEVIGVYWEGEWPHIGPTTFRTKAGPILRNEWFLYLENGP